MEVNNVVENLIKDIQDIEKNINSFKNSSSIPTIEIDLVLSKLRDLYDSVVRLNEIPPPVKNEEAAADTVDEVLEDIPEETEPADQAISESNEKEIIPEEEGNKDFELETEVKDETEYIDKEEEPEAQDEEVMEKENGEKKSAGIIADHLAGHKQFRNETLGQTRQGDLSTKLQSKPLKDISAAIGINDRFLYIKELFDGNSKRFDETIKVLNNSPNFNEAFNYLSENFNWDMDNPAVQTLLELTRRKHIINTDE